MAMEPPQAHRCAVSKSKIFLDTLSEMASAILDIEQKIQTISEKKNKKTQTPIIHAFAGL